MITIRKGSRVYKLLSVLASVGEYPMRSIRLFGDYTSWYKLIVSLTKEQEYRIPNLNKSFTNKLIILSGNGPLRSIRLYKGGLAVLEAVMPEAFDYYMENYGRFHHTGKAAEIDRFHRVAESAAMCTGAGIDSCQYELPLLQMNVIQNNLPTRPIFYLGRDLKYAGTDGCNKTKFSRFTGAVFYPGGCYVVYNSRDSLMKWNGEGESKSRVYLTEVARMNAGIDSVTSSIMFGKDYQLADRTLAALTSYKGQDLRFDKIYQHMHYIPMNAFGFRLLKLITIPDWKDIMMDILFEPDSLPKGKAVFEHDALEDGVHVLSFLDSDILRLFRFRTAILEKPRNVEVLCFTEQVGFLRKYLGPKVPLRTVNLDEVEENMLMEGCDANE